MKDWGDAVYLNVSRNLLMRTLDSGFATWHLVICMEDFICFCFKGTGGEVCKCHYDCEGKDAFISFFCFVIYFYIFLVFSAKMITDICTSKDMTSPGNMYIYKVLTFRFICLVSYMPRLFFQKITWIYANRDKNKDVQNKVLNVYCTLYLFGICLIRRVNVFILQVGFEV